MDAQKKKEFMLELNWSVDAFSERYKVVKYRDSAAFWRPFLVNGMSPFTGESKEDLRRKYLSDSTLAWEGYNYCKSRGFRKNAAYLLSNYRKFKNNYRKEFET